MPYRLEFYEEETGRKPVLDWITKELDRRKRRHLGTVMREVLEEQGIGVCGTSFGRHLGGSLFEFRVQEEDFLLRVFCHAYGDQLVLLLGGYDKGQDPSRRRQETEIKEARRRLRLWQEREGTSKAGGDRDR